MIIFKGDFIMNYIETANLIANKMIEGKKLSKALALVYDKRELAVPCDTDILDVKVVDLKMSSRTTNALMRAGLTTIGKVVDYCERQRLTDIRLLGKGSAIEMLETILDYCWEELSNGEKAEFLLDVAEKNVQNLRKELR
jgi:DNA-directed RNA polymerase alpha subunit